MAQFSQNLSVEGLRTITINIPNTGMHSFDGKISLSRISSGNSGNSSVLVTINKNGSPVYTGSAGRQGFFTKISCTAADVITIVLTSSDSDDVGNNIIKTSVSVSECA